MRKAIYLAVIEQLKRDIPEIMYYDLWNQNIEFIQEETAWDRPAVFIEFLPIEWRTAGAGIQQADIVFHLHVATDWNAPAHDGSTYQDEALQVFDLLDRIHRSLYNMRGEGYNSCKRLKSSTNHNHEEIMENIETYGIHVDDRSAIKS
jgi:hypothetical protein